MVAKVHYFFISGGKYHNIIEVRLDAFFVPVGKMEVKHRGNRQQNTI